MIKIFEHHSYLDKPTDGHDNKSSIAHTQIQVKSNAET